MKGDNLTVETLLATEGWGALDLSQSDNLNAEQHQQALLIAGNYQAVFCNSEQGRFVLRDMVANHLLPRIVQPGDDQFQAGIRQGQADVVRKILALIEFSKTGGAPT